MKPINKIIKISIFSFFLFSSFLIFSQNTNAQTCSVNCTCSSPGNCSRTGSSSGGTCTWVSSMGACICLLPSCEGGTACTTTGDSCYRSGGTIQSIEPGCCGSGPSPTTPPSGTTPPGATTPPSGWGACGSCSDCGPYPSSECVRDPSGNCLWDPATCRSAPPPATCRVNIAEDRYTVMVGAGPVDVRVGFNCIVEDEPRLKAKWAIEPDSAYNYCNGALTPLACSGRQTISQDWAGICPACWLWRGTYNWEVSARTNPGYAQLRAEVKCQGAPTCYDYALVTIVPATSATLDIVPDPINLGIGEDVLIVANIVGDPVDQVTFSAAPVGAGWSTIDLVNVNPGTDTSSPYNAVVTGLAEGTTTLTATASIGGMDIDSDTVTINVSNISDPWFQILGSGAYFNGSVNSLIPTSTATDPLFVLDNAEGFPGIAVYANGTIDFEAGSGDGSGNVSSTNWLAQSGYSGRSYTYEYLESLIPDSTSINTISGGIAGQATFNNAAADSDGYTWIRHNGDLTISGDITLSGNKKVVLIVENGSLIINGNITRNSVQNDFFMAIVQNNISVNGSVANLEGIYFADDQFSSGSSNNQLVVNGSVSANSFNLQRDLEAGNSTTPAELFEFDPNIYANYPSTLNPASVIWREVAP